ncbi:pentapeptide MXKDX repeat protein [Arthrobacter sp. ISL-28]|uniref:pentapeptide MXKDX repeat protein n=1 Tax=Arthrobacter sp. ISL-28 TaxID=2819108 RepID=UPI001BE594AC|nr:pentapeptide MXKDX repeat protein [Arthrobacter sp. ISL-28]MBT2519453.1 hypothetical protein [Arthrobacter sp. ISL-28]
MRWVNATDGRRNQDREVQPHILELRIHGIRNTPPAEMLCTSPESIKPVRGDVYGNFWILKEPTVSRTAQDALPESVPPGVRREAYSWGTLNRKDATGTWIFGRLGQVLTQIAWTLLLPFGFCNVAYWARKLPVPEGSLDPAAKARKGGWMHGEGAASIRVFALGLTLFFAIGLAAVSLDLVGIQCFRDARQVCSQLPGFLDLLADWTRGQRLAFLSLVPLSAVLLLYFVSRRSRVVYEENVYAKELNGADLDPDEGSLGSPNAPILSTAGFWRHALLSSNTERLHLAASFSFLAGLLAWDALNGEVPVCSTAPSASPACFPLFTVWLPWAGVAIAAAAILLLLVIAAQVVIDSEACPDISRKHPEKEKGRDRPTGTVAGVLLAGAILLFVLGIVNSAGASGSDPGRPFVAGLVTTVLVAVLLVLSLSALGWRRGVRNVYSLPLLGVMAASLLLVGWGDVVRLPDAVLWTAAAVSAALFLVLLLRRKGDGQRYEGWRGCGPGVMMLLAVGTAMFLSSLLVVGTASYLNWPLYEGVGSGLWRTAVDRAALVGQEIVIPAPYLEFGVILTAIVGAALAAVVLVVAGHLVRAPQALTTPEPPPPVFRPELADYGAGRTIRVRRPFNGALEKSVVFRRRQAALAQRAEPFIAILAGLLALGVTAALTISTTGSRDGGSGHLAPWLPTFIEDSAEALAIFMLASVGIAILGSIIAGIFVPADRPAALLWDLICFLPRAGHPFGPPCYADRVVPEITDRVQEWLSGEVPENEAPLGEKDVAKRQVVLSAHSLGAVLAIAVILNIDEKWRTSAKIGLLTYGTQVRPYFGRFFPELLGPCALGNRHCRGPSLISADPWYKQVKDDFDATAKDATGNDATAKDATAKDATAKDATGKDATGKDATGNEAARKDAAHSALPPASGVLTLAKVLTPASPNGANFIIIAGLMSNEVTTPEPAWINLWRRTDFLGFPANSYAMNPVDRGADELERHTYMLQVATHGGYPYTLAYRSRFEELVQRM